MVAPAKNDCGRSIHSGLGHAIGFGATLEKSAGQAETESKGSRMKNLAIALLFCLLLSSFVAAQDNRSSYAIAWDMIREADTSGATSLDLSNLGLIKLPPEIGILVQLEELSLGSNQLSELPAEIGNLVNLHRLDVQANRLTSLPLEIGNLTSLIVLDLAGNELASLLPEIGNLQNLETLWLQLNRLRDLPAEIGKLGNLRRLGLGMNQLNSLPSEFGNLTRLEFLALNNNQLETLLPEFGNLSNLQDLYLDHNRLSSLPSEIVQLRNLCHLELSNNQLRYLPDSFGVLQILAIEECPASQWHGLKLDGNPLISPPEEVLAQGTSAILEYLRNEAWWHLQRLILTGAMATGLLTALVLGLRWRNNRGKQKRKVKDLL
jgi:hypothetical protein